MKIYTKTGDKGFSQRADGRRVRKDAPRLAAVGSLDELTAHLGLCACQARAQAAAAKKNKAKADRLNDLAATLQQMQGHLLSIGAVVASAGAKLANGVEISTTGEVVRQMEAYIDKTSADLAELECFILPGGSELACRLHVARAVCRRAERDIVALFDENIEIPPVLLRYVNRLGDVLFVLARLANHEAGWEEKEWRTTKSE
jgi:cob(I)alamin adenosyltransferase